MFGALVIFICQKFLVLTGLMLIDRSLGVVFGLARGALIVLILSFVARPFVSGSDMWTASVFLPYFDGLSQLIFTQYAEAFDFSQSEII
jgi:membrane protein required for colicin V production